MEHLNEFGANNWLLIIMWFVLLGMIINTFLKASYNISPQQSVILMSHEEGTVIIDVREDSEYQSGHIKDSIHIPLSKLASRINELKKYKDKNVILGCQSGNRSSRACGMLKKNGFEKVHNLSGGVMAWKNDNLPMNKKK